MAGSLFVPALAGRTKYPLMLPFPCGDCTVTRSDLTRESFTGTCCASA